MADLHREFGVFHSLIRLSIGKQAALKIARNMIRERIRTYFREAMNTPIPKFRSQGADAMDTVINPIDGEYGTIDGVYLQHLNPGDDSKWPAPAVVHQWLIEATSGQPGDGRTGIVQARYSGPYHVNLRAYGQLKGKLMLAVDGRIDTWRANDPMPYIRWFNNYANLRGEQLRRIVRYLKAWADHQSRHRGPLPGGLILTMLAVNHYQNHKRDDLAFAKTLMTISTAARSKIQKLNPKYIYEELSASLTETQRKRLQEAVREAAADAFEAVSTDNRREASRCWRRQLGNRFPKTE